MQITKTGVDVYAEVDVSVEVSLDDIRDALDDAIIASERNNTKYPVMMFCRGLYDCMRALTDEMIDRLPTEDRQRIVELFEAEVGRFRIAKESESSE